MNRDGQVWIDRNDDETMYLVIEGPKPQDLTTYGSYYVVLDLVNATRHRWSVSPTWEEDRMLRRIL